jgi:hypothetical protein
MTICSSNYYNKSHSRWWFLVTQVPYALNTISEIQVVEGTKVIVASQILLDFVMWFLDPIFMFMDLGLPFTNHDYDGKIIYDIMFTRIFL